MREEWYGGLYGLRGMIWGMIWAYKLPQDDMRDDILTYVEEALLHLNLIIDPNLEEETVYQRD